MTASTEFERVYEDLRAPLYAFLLRLSGRAEVANDLLQETWLRLVRSGAKLSNAAPLRPWLFTVAKNVYRSHRRRARLEVQRLRELAEVPCSAQPSPFDAVALGGERGALERAIARLPAAHREVLVQCSVNGLGPAEVAVLLRITPEAARQRLSRARAKLRRCIDEAGALAEVAALLAFGITYVARTLGDTAALFAPL